MKIRASSTRKVMTPLENKSKSKEAQGKATYTAMAKSQRELMKL